MGGDSPIANVAGWPEVSLAEITTKIGSGATPRGGSETYLDSRIEYALIRSQNVFDRRFDRDGLAYITNAQADGLRGVVLQRSDVLLNITGDGVTFGRSCIVPEDVRPACVNQHVSIIRVDPEKADAGYVLAFLTHPDVKPYIESFNAGGSRRAITKGHIESFRLPLPPLGEQRAIARILGALDDKIELNRKMNATLEAMARALFKSWFVDFDPVRAKAEGRTPAGMDAETAKLFPSEFEDSELGEIPKGWRAGTLAQIAELNSESWSAKTAPPTVSYVDLSNTKWGKIDSTTHYSWADAPSRARRVFRPGDSVVGTVRPGNGSYALITDEGLTGSTGFAVLRPKAQDGIAFVYLASTSKQNIESLAHLADGGAYPAVRPEVVSATPVVIPDEPIMAAFEKAARPLYLKIAGNDRESRELSRIRDTLLPRLLSGELPIAQAQQFVEATA